MKRIVIKVGTNILTTPEGKLDLNYLKELSSQIAHLRHITKCDVILVSSGSITCGSERLNLLLSTIPEKQASASVGQFLLMKEYDACFSRLGIQIGQILLTHSGIDDPVKKKHIKNTITTLFSHNIIPIINQNDSVSIEEIESGDNDGLASRVSVIMNADMLLLLTDTDGLYNKNPKINLDATLIHHVNEITDEIYKMCEIVTSDSRGKGGMMSKIEAAHHATNSGISTFIGNGKRKNIIIDAINKKPVGTYFNTERNL